MKIGEKGTVRALFLGFETVARLRLLGVESGKEITLLKRGFFSRTYLIATKDGRLGLRKKTAEKIFLFKESLSSAAGQ